MKPATPLPWETAVNGEEPPQWDVCGADDGDMVADLMNMPKTGEQDAAYIVHACNAYPELVAALKYMSTDREDCWEKARALLARLGE